MDSYILAQPVVELDKYQEYNLEVDSKEDSMVSIVVDSTLPIHLPFASNILVGIFFARIYLGI